MILVAISACLILFYSQSVMPARLGGYIREAPKLVPYLYLGRPLPANSALRASTRQAMVDYVWRTPRTILTEITLPLVPFLTLAFLAIRLQKPRPPWRELLRQPGTAAVLAVVLTILIEVDLSWIAGVTVPTPLPLNTGLAVALAWTVLGVTRLWQGEASWVDRLGQVLGVCWIALGLVVAADGWTN